MLRTKIMLVFGLSISCLWSLQSCKKSNDPEAIQEVTVKPDTLSAGWSKQVKTGNTIFSDIFFNSSTNGYLLGSRTYKSTDGGITWNEISANSSLDNVFVTNDGKAFFVQRPGNSIYKTLDGGATFSNLFLADQPMDIYFVDNTNGYSISSNGLYSTNDGGVTWVKITTSGIPAITGYGSLYFFSNTQGWIVSSNGGIYRSTGTLNNWQTATISGTTNTACGSVYATSATVVYAVNYAGEILKSINGGANFSVAKITEIIGYADIHFATDQIGYVSGGRFVYKTTDAGANWTKEVSIGEGTLGEVHFSDINHGWVCGANGNILTFKQ